MDEKKYMEQATKKRLISNVFLLVFGFVSLMILLTHIPLAAIKGVPIGALWVIGVLFCSELVDKKLKRETKWGL